MIPEAVVAMLAVARIGAIHSVVFGGFSADSLASRIDDAEASLVITADGGYRKGKVFPLKPVVDEALAKAEGGTVRNVLVVRRGENEVDVDRRPRPVVARHRGAGVERARGAGVRGGASALHPLHLGHHREAEGHPAHVAAATSRRRRSRTGTCSTCTPRPTSTGARPTSAGSPATPTWSTARSRTARRRCSTRAPPTRRTPAAGGRSSRSTRCRSSTPRPRPSARS